MSRHIERTYRQRVSHPLLTAFRVVVQETDLHVQAERPLIDETRDFVLRYRGHIEGYIRRFPDFRTSLVPWKVAGPAPPIVRDMAEAGAAAGVGPMAAVAGAIAQRVGRRLLEETPQVIVENGGDVFINTSRPVTVALYAGRSPLSMRLGLKVDCGQGALCVCTSSGTVGHSLSLGRADAVCVLSPSGALADAAATAVGNGVQTAADIQPAVERAREISGLAGLVVICGDKIGMWGKVEIAALAGKKG
jgi:ApbE superfamily uncharacterized protein (UPF0280 family)